MPIGLLMLCSGTLGDIRPYLALGRALNGAGYVVTIATHAPFARMVEEQGLGLVAHEWQGIPAAARRLAEDASLHDAIRARLRALPENRAVYEVLDVIAAEIRRA